ncbi:MAG TPA: hypothetical protein VHU86_00650 [Solirubrobacterales bacterium]|jgi:hypothetical protein|nr:hypothetical protein [Solirubrobacterales bacterium]
MRRRLGTATILALVVPALLCAAALAVTTQIGNLKASATAEFKPRVFPAHGTVPATFGSVVRIKTVNGEQPPALKTLIFEFDKHGKLNTKGVPTCTTAQLEGTTTTEARKRCAGALVGTGVGKARVEMPGKAPFVLTSPISIFNAPPEGGKPALIAHAYETVPSPQALLVPFTIEKINHGRYGYRAELELPPIAGGYGAATLAEAQFGRTFKSHGKKVGYVEGECSGGRLQVHGELIFTDGSFLQSLLTSPCHIDG